MLVRGRVVMKGQLIVTAPSGDVRTVALGDRRLLLGRSSSSDLSFPDELGLSRQHAALEQEGEGWVLTDLGSRNGTYVNGVRVEGKQALHNHEKDATVARAADGREDAAIAFQRVRELADRAAGAPPHAFAAPGRSRKRAPRLTEPWFC